MNNLTYCQTKCKFISWSQKVRNDFFIGYKPVRSVCNKEYYCQKHNLPPELCYEDCNIQNLEELQRKITRINEK